HVGIVEGVCRPDDRFYGPPNIKPEVQERALTDLVAARKIPATALKDPTYDKEAMRWEYIMDSYGHRMVQILNSHDREVLSQTYRDLGRYARLKLSNFVMAL